MGQPGAKKLDQIMSVTPGDVHMIQPPGPSPPVPVPHPVPNSLIKDEVAEKVKVMGFPGAVKGSISQHTPPHIPMGGTFVNPPKNKGKIITGSANVFYQDKEAAMMGDTAEMCMDPSDAPVGKVIGKAALVLVGGGGSGGEGDGSGDGQGKKAGGAAGAGLGQVTETGHPVDVATGNLIVSGDDFELDGPLPIQFVRTYISSNASTQGPLGYGWVHNFQESLEAVAEGHADWKRIHQELTAAGNPSPDRFYLIYRDPNGLATNYRMPRNGEELNDESQRRRLRREGDTCSIVNRFGVTSRFAHIAGSPGQLQLFEVVDRNGNRNQFRYTPQGLLSEVEDCYGRTLIIVHENQRVTELRLRVSAKDPVRRWCSYKYDAAGDLVEITDRAGSSNRFAYVNHLIAQDQNRDGYSFYFAYDQQRRCIRTWGQDGFLTRYLSYDAEKRRTLEINGEGEQTVYWWNPAGVVWRTEKGMDFSTETRFDEAGRPTVQMRGGVPRFSFDYDDDGNVAAIVDGEGATISYKYNKAGQVMEQTDPAGAKRSFEYDARGNMLRKVEPSGAVIRFEHDQRGRVVREFRSRRIVIATEYDAFGHRRRVANADNLTTYEYDPLGNPVLVHVQGNPPQHYEWNDQGLLARRTCGGRVSASLSYTREGEIAEVLDDKGGLHGYVFSRPGVLSEEAHYVVRGNSRALQSRIHYTTDSEGRVTSAVDKWHRTSRMVYDAAGRPRSEIRFDGCGIERKYNSLSLVEELRTNRGDLERFHYDKRGLPTEVLYRDGSSEKFEYDDCGRLVAASNAWGTVEYEYDAAGNQIVRRQGEFELRAETSRRGAVSWLWPEGIRAEYHRGGGGAIDSVSFGGRRVQLSRDIFGSLISCAYSNGLEQTYERDEDSHLTGFTLKRDHLALLRQRITYDEGRIAAIHSGDGASQARNFRYDVLNRLVEVQGPKPEFYRYDDRDNLVASHRFAASRAVGDMLASAGERTFFYDTHERVIGIRDGDRACRFGYDAKGQIASVQLPDGGQVRYRYDALGRRVEKQFAGGTRNGTKIRFFWDVNRLAKEERWEEEELRSEKFYLFAGLAPLVSIERSGEEERAIFYHNDHTGRPALCTDEKGAVVWEFCGDSFGAGNSPAGGGQQLRSPGQYFDEETGLCYNRHRYYDPLTARFLQPDPISRDLDANRFSYPTDPVGAIDPLGLETMLLVADPQDDVLAGKVDPQTGQRSGGSTARLLGAAPSGTTTANMFDTHEPDLRGVDHVIINAHGNPFNISVREGTFGAKGRMSGKELAEYLKRHGFTGSKVTVVACETGAAGGKFAQDLANGLGPNTTVLAPTQEVSVRNDGSLNVSSSGTDPDGAPFFRGGEMKAFHSDTERTPQPAGGSG